MSKAKTWTNGLADWFTDVAPLSVGDDEKVLTVNVGLAIAPDTKLGTGVAEVLGFEDADG